MPCPPRPPTRPRLRIPGLLSVAAPLLLAGLLPLAPEVDGRWGWSGCWLQPVGDPLLTPTDSSDRATDYRAIRGLRVRDGRNRAHEGADLSNGRGGGPVRAAGDGVVILVAGPGWNRGFGRHVVIAHRLIDGPLVYSVYAHLAPGPALVRRGEYVGAGRVIGKVGMTGRATSPHLHFEIRVPDDPSVRWENAPAIDPLTFVAARLPTCPADSSWSRPYLQWAACAALIPPDAGSAPRPTRAEWWRALLVAARHPVAAVPTTGESLRVAMIALRLLPEGDRGDSQAVLRWDELARDLPRLKALGLRLPWSPVAAARRRLDCRRELAIAAPGREPDSLALAREGGPSRARMCLILADLAGDPPPPPRAPKPRPAAPRPAG